MKTYPYNRASVEGRRLFKLLDGQFNPGVLYAENNRTFSSYVVPSVMQCRANKIKFLFPSNLAGIKRPQIHVEADVELAWGDFAKDVTSLDFTHDNQELPLTYVQPLEDETLKLLIDAGLYQDEHFEELMSKLMQDEVFDAEADVNVSYLNAGDMRAGEHLPVLLVDPVNVVYDDLDPTEHTTIQNLVKRSARLAIELRKEGVKTEDLVQVAEDEQDKEVFIPNTFEDVVAKHEQEVLEKETEGAFMATSDLLDKEIDLTDMLKGSLQLNATSEDDKIRELKERAHEEEWHEESHAPKEPEPPQDRKLDEKQESKTKFSDEPIDFDKDLSDYEIDEDDLEL